MYVNQNLTYNTDKQSFYDSLMTEIVHYYSDFWISNFSNTAAQLMNSLPNINWVGFYLLSGNTLRLGPFQGLPACLDIEVGRGVCGASAARRETIIVANVDDFPGHIVCDSKSKSEIVIPLFTSDKRIFGVLDIDSPILNRFSDEDQKGLELIASQLMKSIKEVPIL